MLRFAPRDSTMAARVFAGSVLTLLLVGAPVRAQVWTADGSERGWIGVSFQVDTDRWGRASDVMITDVRDGSPADEAGLRPGDRLLAINELDSPRELTGLTERLHLRVGDRVVVEVERAGERHRFRLRAGERPIDVEIGSRVEVAISNDDEVEAWVRSMDSLRIELVREGGRGQHIRVRSSTVDRRERASADVETRGTTVRAPFEFFVFRGEAHDSLRAEMDGLNVLSERIQDRIRDRTEELTRRGRLDPVEVSQDSEMQSLSRRLEEVSVQSTDLKSAMAEAARESAGRDYLGRVVEVDAPPAPQPTREAVEFRPLTPYLLGRNRVAGAEVIDLRPELAQYFSVSGGVLVVDVAPGTPAGMAGLVPGDVITRIDQVGVRSVDDLRFGVSMAGDSLPVTLIRQGRSVQVLLRR